MLRLKRLLFLLAMLCCGPLPAWADGPAADADYRPGTGWQIPGSGFRLGGYAAAGLEDDVNQHVATGIDDFSLFVHWEGEGKWRLFSELDLEKPVLEQDPDAGTESQTYLSLERAYVDYLYSEEVNFRAGKFLTPIGRWNVIHAAPLVWTTTRPLVTERTFPTNLTGAMAYGSVPAFGNEVDYSVYTSVGKDWRSSPSLDPFDEAFGMHLTVPTSGLGEIGVSLANFEQRSAIGERRNLLGWDYFWTQDRYEVSTEMAYRFSDKGHASDEKGLFVQGVAPVSGRWYAVARYEFYEPADPGAAIDLWLAGAALRLSPAEIFKVEFSHASNNRIQAPEGFFVSFAVLF